MVMTQPPPVARLVHAARGGDTRAFGELVERFQSMAQGYAVALLRDPGLAEDACQEAFVSELRLANSCTVGDANQVLERCLRRHNRRFMVAAQDPGSGKWWSSGGDGPGGTARAGTLGL